MSIKSFFTSFPLWEGDVIPFSKRIVQPFGGFPDAMKNNIQTTPDVTLPVTISIEGDPDSMPGILMRRKHDVISRYTSKVDESIEEIGPFYLQIKG